MITVTKGAKQELKKILSAKGDNPHAGLRLIASGPPDTPDQFGLSIDSELPGDQVVEYRGSKVLLVGRELAQWVSGRILDTEDTPDGIKLVIHKE